MEPFRYDVNLSILFTELDMPRRPAAAKAAGFEAVEFWWPFATPVPSDREVDAFVTAVQDAGVTLAGLNFFAGDMPRGERGILSHPARRTEFTDNVDVAVGIGQRLGCAAFNALYGNRIEDVDPVEQDAVASENLAHAARAADAAHATVLIEPVSGTPSYPLRTAADARAVIDRVHDAQQRHNLRLLFDIYHLTVNGDDPDAALDRHGDVLGHVQIADSPGRNEPGTGEIDFGRFFDRLRTIGYQGHVGLEYKPTGASADSFEWIRRFHT